ncbi:hypothetical protein [Nocardioides nematodiphilus]|uniref:hypothetical protein n=1 Tax=Nocardioides nematodiphilus TaxID=2849669 RepID=UPI001CD933B7|nr:hypothetical protein [Nocardioides nematodiphilus]MCA1982868.1 hypothetical protein [Nocardioides nematodiphilus]
MSRRPARRSTGGGVALGIALGLVIGGAAVGLASVALHGLWWGLLLSAAASLAVVWALPPRWWTLPPYAVGWWIPFLVAWQGRREGDYAIENGRYGYALLILAIVLLAAAMSIATLRAPARGSAPRGAR